MLASQTKRAAIPTLKPPELTKLSAPLIEILDRSQRRIRRVIGSAFHMFGTAATLAALLVNITPAFAKGPGYTPPDNNPRAAWIMPMQHGTFPATVAERGTECFTFESTKQGDTKTTIVEYPYPGILVEFKRGYELSQKIQRFNRIVNLVLKSILPTPPRETIDWTITHPVIPTYHGPTNMTLDSEMLSSNVVLRIQYNTATGKYEVIQVTTYNESQGTEQTENFDEYVARYLQQLKDSGSEAVQVLFPQSFMPTKIAGFYPFFPGLPQTTRSQLNIGGQTIILHAAIIKPGRYELKYQTSNTIPTTVCLPSGFPQLK